MKNLLYLLYMESGNFFACCENSVFLYSGFFLKLTSLWKFPIYMNLMKSAIKVDDDYVVFKSNKIVSKGISQLLLV